MVTVRLEKVTNGVVWTVVMMFILTTTATIHACANRRPSAYFAEAAAIPHFLSPSPGKGEIKKKEKKKGKGKIVGRRRKREGGREVRKGT